MYKLIDMLCVYKTLILKYEELNNSNYNSSPTNQTSQLAIFCDDKHF